jgi:hypothetical protein
MDKEALADPVELIGRLELHVATTMGGWANARALSTFNRLLRDFAEPLNLPQHEPHLEALRFWAETLYSTRRQGPWESSRVRQMMLGELARFRLRLG